MRTPVVRIPSRLPAALIERIEAWRLAQPAPPSKTAALTYLIERGLDAVCAPAENDPAPALGATGP
jgi:hypothetical protein